MHPSDCNCPLRLRWTSVAILLLTAAFVSAQEPPTASIVPNLVSFSATSTDVSGKPLSGTYGVTFSLYKDSEGGEALWTETQEVQADSHGHYTVMLGSKTSQGLPTEFFSSGEARWLGVQAEGQAGQSRVLLLSVPYALKAADAETIGGLPPSAFMLATGRSVQVESAAAALASLPAVSALTAVAVTGSGTLNFVPLWTSGSAIGNSALFQSGSGSTAKVGINNPAPATTLDVSGASTLRGTLSLPAEGAASTATGFNSQPITLAGSSFSSSTSKPMNETFAWETQPLGNNTTSPSGKLSLLFASATGALANTGLNFASNGQITFAAGQKFPSAGTITGVTAGTELKGGGTSGNVTLSLDTTKIPQLNVNNTFTGNESVTGNVTATGTVAGGLGSFIGNSSNSILNVIQNATSGPGFGVVGTSYNNNHQQAAVLGQELSKGNAGVFGVEGFIFGPRGAGVYGQVNSQSAVGAANATGAGVWGDSGSGGAAGLLGTAGIANAALTLNNSTQNATILAENQNTSIGVLAPALAGFSFAPNGMAVVGSGPVHSKTFDNAIADIFQPYGVAGDSPAGTGVAGFTDIATAVSGAAGTGVGVTGTSISGNGIVGTSYSGNGIVGITSSDTSDGPAGVIGEGLGAASGVYGFSSSGSAVTGFGAQDVGVFTTSDTGDAYNFIATNVSGDGCVIITSDGDTNKGIFCTGVKSAIVPVADRRWVALYAVESPENWFEDFGSAKLVNGSATVVLEPIFTQTVNVDMDYHVFPAPNGDCKGLYIASKSASGFVVQELGGGHSNIPFDYRIVARRKGYENLRMHDMTETHGKSLAMAQKMAKRAQLSPAPVRPIDGARSMPQIQGPILPRQPVLQPRSTVPAPVAQIRSQADLHH
jgi:hypothetical protein